MASKPKLPISFEPVPVRPRHDGWTVERQIAFVEKLADTNSITAACKHVGMSRESVRRLRRHRSGRDFRDACDAALDCAYAELGEAAAERSRNRVAARLLQGRTGRRVASSRRATHHVPAALPQAPSLRPEADGLPLSPRDVPLLDVDRQLPFDPEEQLDATLEAVEFSSPPEEEPALD